MLTHEMLETARLRLNPIAVEDAEALVEVFDDPAMLVHIGGDELTREVLLRRFRGMPAGSGSEDEGWLTWTIRRGGVIIGIVQATVRAAVTDLAWVIGREWQNQGFASEAALAVCGWLDGNGVTALGAHIHPDNVASHAVAARLGLHNSGVIDEDGEEVWVSDPDLWPPSESAAGPER